jgi:selenide,water dikinase
VNDVDLIIESLPIFDQMNRQIKGMPNFKLLEGFSAETSGGILTMVHHKLAKDFVNEAKEKYGQEVWIIGRVIKGTKKAILRQDV